MPFSPDQIQAIIFDMDGVIVDSEPVHEAASIRVMADFGVTLVSPDFTPFKGRPSISFYEHMAEEHPGLSLSAREMLDRKQAVYREMLPDMGLIPNVVPFLKAAKSRFRITLVTSADRYDQEFIFESFDLAEYFEAIVTADDIEHGKPHPDPYLKSLGQLGLPGSNCLVIEDSLLGVQSGVGSGCHVAGLTGTFTRDQLLAEKADFTVEDFQELAKVFGLTLQ